MITKILGITVLSVTLVAYADDAVPQQAFTPKAFYRVHEERKYNYKVFGVGLEYKYENPLGLNVKLGYMTAPFAADLLTEIEANLSYKFKIDEHQCYFPIFTNRVDSHRVHKEGETKWYVDKHTIFAGIGYQYAFNKNYRMHAHVQVLRDMRNTTAKKKKDVWYIGRSYHNPVGARGTIGFQGNWGENQSLAVEGYYARTFETYYIQTGAEVSYTWGF
jgi:hypothetical protein